MKKIGINGYFLTKPYTGIYRYTVNVITALCSRDPSLEIEVIVPEEIDVKFKNNVNVTVVPYAKIPTKSLKKWYFEQVQVARFFKDKNVDVALYPYPANSLFCKNIPTAVAIHDIIPWTEKAYRKTWKTRAYQNFVQKNLVHADILMCVSKETQKRLSELMPEVKEKTTYVPNMYLPREIPTSYVNKGQIMKKYGIRKKYMLYVGGYDERKNVQKLVRAFKKANRKGDTELVLVGGALHATKLYSSSEAKGKGVVRTGFVSDEDMHALYHYAHGFAHFSRLEGFNLPILYAALHKIPQIVSDIAIHREVVSKKGATFVPSGNTPRLTKLLEKHINSTKKEYSENVREAHKSAQKYALKEVQELLHKVLTKL